MKNDGTMVNAYVAGKGDLSAADQALVARRVKAMGPAYRLFYETPVHLVRGEGVWLYDGAGNAYLDTYNNVASVGHCHPAVVAATAKQAAILVQPYPLFARHRAGLCRALAGDVSSRIKPCDVHLHRVGSQ